MAKHADKSRLAEHLKRELAEARGRPRAKLAVRGNARREGASRGISFNQDLVLAILAGQKTQTRRPVRGDASVCAYAVPGEVVFIREKWARRADGSFALASLHADEKPKPRWQAGRFMPREAARHFLRVLTTRLEPLANLTSDDARAEGAPADVADPVAWFRSAWDAIYGEAEAGSSKRPTVWVITFSLLT